MEICIYELREAVNIWYGADEGEGEALQSLITKAPNGPLLIKDVHQQQQQQQQ